MRSLRPRAHSIKVTYLLTFCCYGTHLPGDARGWVDRTRGDHRGGYRKPSAALERHARDQMRQAPYRLDKRTADTVLGAIREVCVARDWQLVAAHVRSTHVHCVVDGDERPNRVVADFKAYASRVLNQAEGYQKRWAREGALAVLRTAPQSTPRCAM